MRSMAVRRKSHVIIDQWPLAAVIVFGAMLTLVWVATLIWLPLRMLDAI